MVVSGETHTVELTYAGQNISVTETSTSFYNERQKVQVSLAKAIEKDKTFGIGDNGEIKNISFGLYAAEDIVSASGTVIPADGLIEIVSVNENGTAVMKSDLRLANTMSKRLQPMSIIFSLIRSIRLYLNTQVRIPQRLKSK